MTKCSRIRSISQALRRLQTPRKEDSSSKPLTRWSWLWKQQGPPPCPQAHHQLLAWPAGRKARTRLIWWRCLTSWRAMKKLSSCHERLMNRSRTWIKSWTMCLRNTRKTSWRPIESRCWRFRTSCRSWGREPMRRSCRVNRRRKYQRSSRRSPSIATTAKLSWSTAPCRSN